MVDTTCSFHPERKSVAICTRCHRNLCSEDRRIFDNKKQVGPRTFELIKQDYCPVCYVTLLKRNDNKIYFYLLGMIFLTIFIPIIGYGKISGNDILYFEIVLIIVIAFTIMFILIINKVDGSKMSNAELEANRFLNSLDDKSILFSSVKGKDPTFDLSHYKLLSLPDSRHLVCLQCVEHLSLTDKFCPNCGNSTDDEFQAMGF